MFGVGDGGSRTENFFFVIEGGSRTEFLFDPVLDGAAEDAAEFDLSPGFPIGPVICSQSGMIFENFRFTSIIIGSIFVKCYDCMIYINNMTGRRLQSMASTN